MRDDTVVTLDAGQHPIRHLPGTEPPSRPSVWQSECQVHPHIRSEHIIIRDADSSPYVVRHFRLETKADARRVVVRIRCAMVAADVTREPVAPEEW